MWQTFMKRVSFKNLPLQDYELRRLLNTKKGHLKFYFETAHFHLKLFTKGLQQLKEQSLPALCLFK